MLTQNVAGRFRSTRARRVGRGHSIGELSLYSNHFSLMSLKVGERVKPAIQLGLARPNVSLASILEVGASNRPGRARSGREVA